MNGKDARSCFLINNEGNSFKGEENLLRENYEKEGKKEPKSK